MLERRLIQGMRCFCFVTAMLLSAACVRVSAPALLLPHDKPQEAEDFERQQRLAWAGAVDARSKYREALEWSARAEERVSAAKTGPRARWQELGPGNIGGRVRTLAIHPDTPDRMLLASVSGGPWRSDDGGLNWRSTGDELANPTINSMALDPSNPSIVYVGTGEGYFREEVRGTDLPFPSKAWFVTHSALLFITPNEGLTFTVRGARRSCARPAQPCC